MSDTKLDEILDIQPELTKTAIIEAEPVDESEVLAPAPESPSAPLEPTVMDNDLTYARNKMKQLIDSAQITLESAIAVAEETSEPRAFEVVGTLLQSLVTANKELLQLHKTKADATKAGAETKSAPKSGGDVHIGQAMFVGRAQDLLAEIKKAKREALEAVAAEEEKKNENV